MTISPSLLRLNNDGTVDGTFDPGPGASNVVRYFFKEAAGHVLITGNFTSLHGATVNGLATVDAAGTLVAPYDGGAGLSADALEVVADGAGDLYVAGAFTSYGRAARNRIARINPDGTIDDGFAVGSGFDSWTYVIALDGTKVVVGGTFTTYSGTAAPRLTRLATDGTVDPTFNVGTGFNNAVRAVTPAGGGKLYVGGNFTQVNGAAAPYMVRLNADGSVDPGFACGVGFAGGGVLRIARQVDGKVIVVGYFTSYQGAAANRIIRLNPDGTPDATFATGAGFNNHADVVYLAPSGKIYVGGAFTAYDGTPVKRLVRLTRTALWTPRSRRTSPPVSSIPYGRMATRRFTAVDMRWPSAAQLRRRASSSWKPMGCVIRRFPWARLRRNSTSAATKSRRSPPATGSMWAGGSETRFANNELLASRDTKWRPRLG